MKFIRGHDQIKNLIVLVVLAANNIIITRIILFSFGFNRKLLYKFRVIIFNSILRNHYTKMAFSTQRKIKSLLRKEKKKKEKSA